MMKDQLTNDDSNDDKEALRIVLSERISQYRGAYQQLKDLKLEIEHLQHLLEQARHRLTRDFEHWYINVYLATQEPISSEENEMDSASHSRPQMPINSLTTLSVGASEKMNTLEDIPIFASNVSQNTSIFDEL